MIATYYRTCGIARKVGQRMRESILLKFNKYIFDYFDCDQQTENPDC